MTLQEIDHWRCENLLTDEWWACVDGVVLEKPTTLAEIESQRRRNPDLAVLVRNVIYDGDAEWTELTAPAVSPVVSYPAPDRKTATRSRTATAAITVATIAVVVGVLAFIAPKLHRAHQREQAAENYNELMALLEQKVADRNLLALKARLARISMSKNEVIRSLGQPQQRQPAPASMRNSAEEIWIYSNGGVVVFDYDGRVISVSDEIDYDNR